MKRQNHGLQNKGGNSLLFKDPFLLTITTQLELSFIETNCCPRSRVFAVASSDLRSLRTDLLIYHKSKLSLIKIDLQPNALFHTRENALNRGSSAASSLTNVIIKTLT